MPSKTIGMPIRRDVFHDNAMEPRRPACAGEYGERSMRRPLIFFASKIGGMRALERRGGAFGGMRTRPRLRYRRALAHRETSGDETCDGPFQSCNQFRFARCFAS